MEEATPKEVGPQERRVMPTVFIFALDAVLSRTDPYFVTSWDRSTPVTVRAATREEAINKARTALGNCERHHEWQFRVRSIRDVAIAEEEEA